MHLELWARVTAIGRLYFKVEIALTLGKENLVNSFEKYILIFFAFSLTPTCARENKPQIAPPVE